MPRHPNICNVDEVVASRPWAEAVWRLRGAYAESTLRLMIRLYARLDAWCVARGECASPIPAEVLARYVAEFSRGRSASTVSSLLAAVTLVHRANGFVDPGREREVTLAYRVALRSAARPPRQAQGLTAGLRDRLMEACPETVKGVRDRALISVGYDTLCRPSELVGMRIEDLRREPNGGASVRIWRAKTDAFNHGQCAFISRRGLADLEAWLGHVKAASGPVFRKVIDHEVQPEPLKRLMVQVILQRRGRAAALEEAEVQRLTGQSMRVGAAQDLVMAGRTLLEVMRAGRWRTIESVAAYVRAAPVNVWAREGLEGPGGARSLTVAS